MKRLTAIGLFTAFALVASMDLDAATLPDTVEIHLTDTHITNTTQGVIPACRASIGNGPEYIVPVQCSALLERVDAIAREQYPTSATFITINGVCLGEV